MKKIKKIYPWIIWSVIIVIIAAYLYLFFISSGGESQYNKNNVDNISCPIEYSNIECINSTPVIGFFNPNKFDLDNISLTVPANDGVDVYHVIEPLKNNTTETLIIFNSPCSLIQSKIRVHWCCGECYTFYMDKPTQDIKVGK